mgnify:FL=1
MADLEMKTDVKTEAEPKAKEKGARRAERKTTDAPPERAKGFWCYIGPNIKGLAQIGSIYRGNKEEALRALAGAIEKEAAVKALLVPGEQLAGARVRVRTPGNALYEAYRRAARKGEK